MSENSIEFSLSNSEQRDSWLNSGHWTLDTDRWTVNRDGGLEPSCSRARSLHLISLLLLFLASQSFLLPLGCTSHSSTFQFPPTATTRRRHDGTTLLISL